MESDKASFSPPPSTSPIPQRQARLYAVLHRVGSLAGRGQKTVARGLFTNLARTTNVKAGRLFLSNREGKPEYCVILVNSQLIEYDETTCPPLQEQALAGEVFRQREDVLIADTATDPRWLAWANAPEASAARSALATSILVAGQPVGALALIAENPNHFTKTDLALITNLVSQAAVIIENARLISLIDQTQTTIHALHQSTQALRTTPDLQQTLRTVLQQLTQAVPAQYALALLCEEDTVYPIAVMGFEEPEKFVQQVLTPADIPTIYHALDQGHVIIKDDEKGLSEFRAWALSEPIRTWAMAPLMARTEILGGVILASHEAKALDHRHLPTIGIFADHIAIALTNHRLTQETDRRLRELAFLNETGQAITSTLNLERILHLLLERVRDLLKIDAVSIALRDGKTGDLVFEAASGAGAAAILGVRLRPGQGIAGWVAETGKPLIVQDVYSDARFLPDIDKITGVETRSILCMPIVLKGTVVGVISALNPEETPFDEQAIELINALSGLAATAIDNARLFEQVRSAEARYEGLFEDSANPIIITDLEGTVVEANRNACALLGQPKEALRGTKLTQLNSADGNLDFVGPLAQIQEGQEAIFQTCILSKGHRITVEVKGKKILVKDTALIQWIGRDITAELELEQTRDDMVRMIIHDLRNPLANIMNSLDVLNDVITSKETDVSLDELLKIAKRSGKRMHQLISSILDISRIEAGQAILQTKPTELVPLLEDAIEFIKPQTDIREIQLTGSFGQNLPQVEIDSDMISRVVLNLLDNASKYTQMGGRINLTANALAAEVEVAVSDNGPGIPSDQLESIFEKFSRVRYRRGPEGTGLGLTFCRLAITAHGGRIWAESVLGQGTTLRFTLPVHTPPQQTQD